MLRPRIRWAAVVVLLGLAGVAAALLWVSKRPVAVMRPDPTPPVLVKQPLPEPPPTAVIRGVTGFRYSGGPPPNPFEPRPEVTYPQYGFVVSLFEKESGKKVAETVSKSDGRFEVKVQPGTYRVVLHYARPDDLGNSTFEQIAEAKPDNPVELDLYQSVNVP